MIKSLPIIFILIFQSGKCQIIKPFEDEKCQMFSYNIQAKDAVKIEYLNDERYSRLKSSKIALDQVFKEENLKLLNEFKMKFPLVFSDSCATFSFYEDNKLRKVKSCKVKFKLVDKKAGFYVFQMSGFEIYGFLLYNEKNKVSIITDNFPQILENGKYILSIDNGLDSAVIQFYKKAEKDYSNYEIRIESRFRIDEYYLLEDHFKNLNLIFSVTSKALKLIEEGKDGKQYALDENNGCNFKVKINY